MRLLFILFLLLPLPARADTAQGVMHYEAGEYEKAYGEFYAEVDDGAAHYWLGMMYQKGQFVEQNDFEALLHFEKAGHLNHVEAMREAIRYHLNGWGTLPNRALAGVWIKLSADADPDRYLMQFKRFHRKLTTFERLEYEERLERKRY
jgi:TPR repeat protein